MLNNFSIFAKSLPSMHLNVWQWYVLFISFSFWLLVINFPEKQNHRFVCKFKLVLINSYQFVKINRNSEFIFNEMFIWWKRFSHEHFILRKLYNIKSGRNHLNSKQLISVVCRFYCSANNNHEIVQWMDYTKRKIDTHTNINVCKLTTPFQL